MGYVVKMPVTLGACLNAFRMPLQQQAHAAASVMPTSKSSAPAAMVLPQSCSSHAYSHLHLQPSFIASTDAVICAVLLDEYDRAVVADIGLGKMAAGKATMASGRTPLWASPVCPSSVVTQ